MKSISGEQDSSFDVKNTKKIAMDFSYAEYTPLTYISLAAVAVQLIRAKVKRVHFPLFDVAVSGRSCEISRDTLSSAHKLLFGFVDLMQYIYPTVHALGTPVPASSRLTM
jgi:hypothetical protein